MITMVIFDLWSFIDEGNHTAGIVLKYPQGDACLHSTTENYQLSIAVVWDNERQSDIKIEVDTKSLTTPCTPKIIVYSNKGCAILKINPLFEWMENVKFVLGPIAGLLGVFFMICGLY